MIYWNKFHKKKPCLIFGVLMECIKVTLSQMQIKENSVTDRGNTYIIIFQYLV